jgi:arginase
MKFGILGIPFNGDGTRPEIENPAAALREAGMSALPLGFGDGLLDYGDLDIPAFEGIRDPSTEVLNIEAWKEISRQTAKKLLLIQKEVDFAIILGGDCSILLGIYGAFNLARMRVGLVSLDGHTDYRDPSSSATGEPADLELAILTGRGPYELTGLWGLPPLIQQTDVVVCGYREPDMIGESKIHHFDCRGLKKTGPENLANMVLALLKHLDRLWFHLDVDVLDPTIMPACFPEPDGLLIDEVLSFLATSIRSKKFMGMSVACYHPNLDLELQAAAKVVGMLGSALSSCT